MKQIACAKRSSSCCEMTNFLVPFLASVALFDLCFTLFSAVAHAFPFILIARRRSFIRFYALFPSFFLFSSLRTTFAY